MEDPRDLDQEPTPPDPQQALLNTLVTLQPELQRRIDQHVEALERLLVEHDPFALLGSLFCLNAVADEAVAQLYNVERNDAYTEYLALLLLTKPSEAYPEQGNSEIADETISRINEQIQAIFRDVGLSVMFHDVRPDSVEPPDPLDRLRTNMLIRSIVVRNPVYDTYHRELLMGLFTPLDRELTELVGFTIADALLLVDTVATLMIERLQIREREVKHYTKQLAKQIEAYKKHTPRHQKQQWQTRPVSEQEQMVSQLASLHPREARRVLKTIQLRKMRASAGKAFSFTPEELVSRTQLPLDRVQAFLGRMSLEFGEVAPAYYRTPAAVHPLMTKPFIHWRGRYLCPVLPVAYRSLRPALEAFLNPQLPDSVNTDNALWARYHKRLRAQYVEEQALAALRQALRHAQSYQSLTYHVGPQRQLVELDGLVLADSVVMLVEAKGSALSLKARRGAHHSLRKELKQVVGEASEQLRRAAQYIQSSDNPTFTLSNGTSFTLPKQQIRHLFLVSVTLDSFDALVTNIAQYSETGLFPEDVLPWAVSLTDLRVISDLLEFGSQFVQYLLRRQKVNEIRNIQAFEELDWFGNYLTEGLFFDDGIPGSEGADLIHIGDYTAIIDAYYLSIDEGKSTVARPSQPLTPLLRRILRELEDLRPEGYLEAGCTLLDLSETARASFLDRIEHQLSRTQLDRSFHDFSIWIEGANCGITCVFAPSEAALELHDQLTALCWPKHQRGGNQWIGLGFLVDAPRFLNACLVFSPKQKEMGQLQDDPLE
jgi:hypothetical protein